MNGHWGALAKSTTAAAAIANPSTVRLRELAMSYFNLYFNMRRERTLRTFSRPVNLRRFDRLNWMTTEEPVWFVVNYLFDIKHYKLLRPEMIKSLHRVGRKIVPGRMSGKSLRQRVTCHYNSPAKLQPRGTIWV